MRRAAERLLPFLFRVKKTPSSAKLPPPQVRAHEGDRPPVRLSGKSKSGQTTQPQSQGDGSPGSSVALGTTASTNNAENSTSEHSNAHSSKSDPLHSGPFPGDAGFLPETQPPPEIQPLMPGHTNSDPQDSQQQGNVDSSQHNVHNGDGFEFPKLSSEQPATTAALLPKPPSSNHVSPTPCTKIINITRLDQHANRTIDVEIPRSGNHSPHQFRLGTGPILTREQTGSLEKQALLTQTKLRIADGLDCGSGAIQFLDRKFTTPETREKSIITVLSDAKKALDEPDNQSIQIHDWTIKSIDDYSCENTRGYKVTAVDSQNQERTVAFTEIDSSIDDNKTMQAPSLIDAFNAYNVHYDQNLVSNSTNEISKNSPLLLSPGGAGRAASLGLFALLDKEFANEQSPTDTTIRDTVTAFRKSVHAQTTRVKNSQTHQGINILFRKQQLTDLVDQFMAYKQLNKDSFDPSTSQ